jgi:uncharacterized LabA/DUF88 family protein
LKGTLLNRIGKIAIFIDGVNLFAAVKSLGFEIDYKRLLQEFRSRGALLRAFYYTTVFQDGEHPLLQSLMDWLAYNGFTVVTKPGKEFVDPTGRRKVKGNINVELAIDAMEIAPHIDQMVLFSGDGDLTRLVEAMQRRGVRVTVISTMPTAAQDLRRQTDEFVDILDLKDIVGRDPATRKSRSSEGYSASENRNPPARSTSNLRVGASGKWDDED